MTKQTFLNKTQDGTKAMPVGLASLPRSQMFQCGNCEYYQIGDSTCHNKHPNLDGRKVHAEWCCNLFDNDDMIVVQK